MKMLQIHQVIGLGMKEGVDENVPNEGSQIKLTGTRILGHPKPRR